MVPAKDFAHAMGIELIPAPEEVVQEKKKAIGKMETRLQDRGSALGKTEKKLQELKTDVLLHMMRAGRLDALREKAQKIRRTDGKESSKKDEL